MDSKTDAGKFKFAIWYS